MVRIRMSRKSKGANHEKKVICLILAMSMIFSITACQSDNEEDPAEADDNVVYDWKGAYVLTEDNPGSEGLKEFARLLNEKSDGRIQLDLYFGGQLGTEKDTLEALQMGGLDVMIASTATLSNFTDSQIVWDLPYLFETRDKARGVLDSEVGKAYLDRLSDVSIKGLTYYENGMYAIGAKEPLGTLEDLKGKKIRSH